MRRTDICRKILTALTLSFILCPGVIWSMAAYPIDQGGIAPGKVAAPEVPNFSLGVHNVGRVGMTVTNGGHFGSGFAVSAIDPLTGQLAPSCVYPYPGRWNYLFAGAFWIGAVVGRDTLVSVGADGWELTREMWPAIYPIDTLERHSIKNPNDVKAVSEQDIIAYYTDTVTNPTFVAMDNTDGRPHVPLNIAVTQRSYAWSYSYAADFVLFDYSIKNIGYKKLNQVYMGIYVDGDVGPVGGDILDAQDDVCGFKRVVPSAFGCDFVDTINIAWIADNDGSTAAAASSNCPQGFDVTGVTGTRVVRTPSDSLKYSFNWWISNGDAAQDFGPRRAGTPDDPFRDFGGFLGTPEGDRNKYYIMRHEEFDYDQQYSAVDHTTEGWLPRAIQAVTFATGFDTRYLLSFGPFDINPGDVLPLSFA